MGKLRHRKDNYLGHGHTARVNSDDLPPELCSLPLHQPTSMGGCLVHLTCVFPQLSSLLSPLPPFRAQVQALLVVTDLFLEILPLWHHYLGLQCPRGKDTVFMQHQSKGPNFHFSPNRAPRLWASRGNEGLGFRALGGEAFGEASGAWVPRLTSKALGKKVQ